MGKTFVRFVHFDGKILAVFMRNNADRQKYNLINSGWVWVRRYYTHEGLHDLCFDGMHKRKQATKKEYTPLANELKSLGYDLTIMNKGE